MNDHDLNTQRNRRLLVIDDNQAIHADFRKILCPTGVNAASSLEAAEAALFGETPAAPVASRALFQVDSAHQGNEALAMVQRARQQNVPYAMAFVDIRMPPGWDGIETSTRLWEVDPDLQIVICTAYSDYSWDELTAKIGNSDRMVILKKPFDHVEVLQLAHALTEKWQLLQAAKQRFQELETRVFKKTSELQKINTLLEDEIKEHKRAARALKESERRYQDLFHFNPLPMWVYDIETLRFLDVNDTALRDYGYTREEFLALTLNDIQPPSDLPLPLDHGAGPRANPDESSIWKHRKKDGALFDVELIDRQIVHSGKNARLVLANDITDRKHAEDRIHEQAMLLDLASDAIFVRDLDNRIHFWNQGATRLYGWTAAEAVGGAVSNSMFASSFANTDSHQTVLETGEWSGEVQHTNKNGERLIVNSRWTLLRDADGKPRSILTIDTDITEKKQLEAQFLRNQRMEAIGTLASGMAHDLNNILSPVLMAAEVLRWPLPPDEFEATLKRIETSARRGADIIKQVLMFGRGVGGERVLLQPQDFLEEMVKLARETFPKGIEIVLHSPGNLWQIRGDRTQIHQVLLNLCVNARDAMPDGGTLKIEAENVHMDERQVRLNSNVKTGPYVVLRVSDTGSGIPPEIIERIFDPFFTTKEQGKGTGLGLSTAVGIMKGHGGSINVFSEPGVGTVFKLYFPALPEGQAPSTSDTSFFRLPKGEGDTILIVDDEAAILQLNRKVLEGYQYRVLLAANGVEAIGAFSKNQKAIKAVVTDIMMPQIDGLALIRSIREIAPNVPILASSGLGNNLGDPAKSAELESLGVRRFLTKPYTAETLVGTLGEMLHRRAK